MTKMKKPEKLWAFWANAYGPWYKKPHLVTMDTDTGLYWHSNRNYSIKKEGLEHRGGYLAFAHRDRSEVEKFFNGFMACRRLFAQFYKD